MDKRYSIACIVLLLFSGAEIAHRVLSVWSDQASYASFFALFIRSTIYILAGALYGKKRVSAGFVLGSGVALSVIEYFAIGFVGIAAESAATMGKVEVGVFIGLALSYPIALLIAIVLVFIGYLAGRHMDRAAQT
jgi:hypothetical protein